MAVGPVVEGGSNSTRRSEGFGAACCRLVLCCAETSNILASRLASSSLHMRRSAAAKRGESLNNSRNALRRILGIEDGRSSEAEDARKTSARRSCVVVILHSARPRWSARSTPRSEPNSHSTVRMILGSVVTLVKYNERDLSGRFRWSPADQTTEGLTRSISK